MTVVPFDRAFNKPIVKKKSATSPGLITDFCVCGKATSPLSTPVPAAEKHLSCEEKNKANKVVDDG
jgi:hypothetical protein